MQELEVVQVHGKPHVRQQVGERGLVHMDKADDRGDRGRDRIFDPKGRGLVHRSLARLDRVDEVAADLIHVRVGQCAFKYIDFCRGDRRPLAAGQELDALRARIRALIELAGQRLDRKHGMSARRTGEALVVAHVRHRLGKDDALGFFIGFGGEALGIVAAEITDVGQPFDLQQVVQAGEQAARLNVEAGLFFGITTIDAHGIVSSLFILNKILSILPVLPV